MSAATQNGMDKLIRERDKAREDNAGLRQMIARLDEENRALYWECEDRMVHADILRDDLQEYHDQFGNDPIARKHDMGAALRNTPDTALTRLKAEWQAEALESLAQANSREIIHPQIVMDMAAELRRRAEGGE